MKKKIIIVIIVILVLIFCLIGLYILNNDNLKFKRHYESLNGKKTDSGQIYLNINIPKKNNVIYLDENEVLDFIDKGTGILYFGFPFCPWCRNAVPILVDKAVENEVNIYYCDDLSIKEESVDFNKKRLNYHKLEKVLKKYLDSNNKDIKDLYFPTAIFIMGGKIVGLHTGTVDSQTDPYKKLTQQQKKELENIYQKNIDKIYGICDESCE